MLPLSLGSQRRDALQRDEADDTWGRHQHHAGTEKPMRRSNPTRVTASLGASHNSLWQPSDRPVTPAAGAARCADIERRVHHSDRRSYVLSRCLLPVFRAGQ